MSFSFFWTSQPGCLLVRSDVIYLKPFSVFCFQTCSFHQRVYLSLHLFKSRWCSNFSFLLSPDFQWITDLYRCASATSLLSHVTTPVWLSSHPDCWERQRRAVLNTQALESGYHLLAFWTWVGVIFSVASPHIWKMGVIITYLLKGLQCWEHWRRQFVESVNT